MPIEFDPADISTWVPALQADNDPELGRLVAYKIGRLTLNKLSSSDWRVFLGSGALDAVFDILCDDYVGGFEWGDYGEEDSEGDVSKDGVLEDDYVQKTLVPYVMDHLMLLANILAYLAEDSAPGNGPLDQQKAIRMRKMSTESPVIKAAVETVVTRYVPLMRILQYPEAPLSLFYDTFSTRKYPEICEERPEHLRDADWTLGDSLVRCHETVDEIAFAFSTDDSISYPLLECACESAMLMFMIWNNCYDQRLSESSFVGFTNTLIYSQPYHGNNPHIGFFRKAMVTMECGDRDFEAVCYQLSKDLRRIEEPVVFEPLIDCLTHFSKERWFAVRTSTQRSVLSHSMAAFRTQICSRKDSKRERMGWYLSSILYNLSEETGRRPLIPELWVHEIVSVMSQVICPIFTGDRANHGIDQFKIAIQELIHMLDYYSRHPSSPDSPHWPARHPPSLAVRKYSLARWKIARNNMRAAGFRIHAKKQILWLNWNVFGPMLERGVNTAQASQPDCQEFGPLERCANQECACSVFRSTHAMRVCKQCFLVSYCNKSCQESDWKRHKVTCIRT